MNMICCRHFSGMARRQSHSHGFTYLGLIILVTIIGMASAATIQMGSVLQKRAAEEELLEIGLEFRNALNSYANATPAGQPRTPGSLEDLLKDPRYPNPRRHLRKLYADPVTGKEEWATVLAPDGRGIIGVHSMSGAAPVKINNFDPPFQEFSGKTSYRDWIFLMEQQSLFPGLHPPVPQTSR